MKANILFSVLLVFLAGCASFQEDLNTPIVYGEPPTNYEMKISEFFTVNYTDFQFIEISRPYRTKFRLKGLRTGGYGVTARVEIKDGFYYTGPTEWQFIFKDDKLARVEKPQLDYYSRGQLSSSLLNPGS